MLLESWTFKGVLIREREREGGGRWLINRAFTVNVLILHSATSIYK